METEDRISKLEEKVERVLSELSEIRKTSGRAFEVNKMINISDEGKGKDK
jgi:regulator of replication initiation timing